MRKKIKKISLIYPPFKKETARGRKEVYLAAIQPPLGILYIAAVLENNRYCVRVLDSELLKLNGRQTVEKCKEIAPDIVGIYTTTSNYNYVIQLSYTIKKEMDVEIVLGGPHPTIHPQETLENKAVDYIVMREGELSFLELIDSINKSKSLKKVKGIGYKVKGRVIINEHRDYIRDLDKLPLPARHLVPLMKYRYSPQHYLKPPVTTMIASRGCPYACTFCDSVNIHSRIYRTRSPDNVIAEIKELKKKYRIKNILFWDDLWGIDKRWVREFCEKMIREKINVGWSCDCRVNTVDKSILKLMKKAGCWSIFYGIESLDQEILDAINKAITVEQSINALKWTKEAGIEIRANFILGLPTETPEKARKMIKTICRLNPDYAKFNVLTPYPKTQIYEEIKQGKWGKMDREYAKLTNHEIVFVPYGYKNAKELYNMRRYFFRKFYLRPRYIFSLLIKMRNIHYLRRYLKGLRVIISRYVL